MEANVGPQSSYLNRGFWVMVAFSPSLRMIFLARAGQTRCKIHRTALRVSMKHIMPAVDRQTATFCSHMFADNRSLSPESSHDALVRPPCLLRAPSRPVHGLGSYSYDH